MKLTPEGRKSEAAEIIARCTRKVSPPVTFEDRVKNAKQRQRDIRHKLLAQARSLMLMQRRTGDGAESSMHVETDNEAGRQKHGNGRGWSWEKEANTVCCATGRA